MMPLFFIGVIVTFAAFTVAQVTALRHWRGGWRMAAAVPAGIVLFVVPRVVVETTADSALQQNQWPYQILTWSGVSLGLLGLLAIARRLALRRERSRLPS